MPWARTALPQAPCCAPVRTLPPQAKNPVVVNCTWADVIVGPIGIILANALWGEITPKMAAAVSECVAKKILIPVNRCSVSVVGVQDKTLSEYVRDAVAMLKNMQ